MMHFNEISKLLKWLKATSGNIININNGGGTITWKETNTFQFRKPVMISVELDFKNPEIGFPVSGNIYVSTFDPADKLELTLTKMYIYDNIFGDNVNTIVN